MFRVGPRLYAVRITADPIVIQGSIYLGLCDAGAHQILISPTVPIDGRLGVMLHELAHAHCFATGQPRDLESLCDFTASVAELAMRDLASAGGEEALKRLDPGEELGAASKITLTRNRYCAVCGGTVAPGDIACRATGDGHVELTVPCDHCDVKARWREVATHGGLPSGVVVGTPVIDRGRGDRFGEDPF